MLQGWKQVEKEEKLTVFLVEIPSQVWSFFRCDFLEVPDVNKRFEASACLVIVFFGLRPKSGLCLMNNSLSPNSRLGFSAQTSIALSSSVV